MTEISYNMKKEDLRKMQLIQIDILKEFDCICKKHNIKYCIVGGTMLGAIRHNGFIPWDNDIDVAMMRVEYEKFVKIYNSEIDNQKYYFQDHKNTKGYRWGYAKLRRKDTCFIRRGQEHMKYESGVAIDIFPLDNIPNSNIMRRVYNCFCTIIRKILWSEVGYVSENNKFKKVFYKIAKKIPLNLVFSFYELLINICKNKNSIWVRKLTIPYPNNKEYGIKKEYYENIKDIEFEGILFSGISEYDEYLKCWFGDYMKMPPIENRVGQSYSYYDFENIEV